jgi:hypothetical protein
MSGINVESIGTAPVDDVIGAGIRAASALAPTVSTADSTRISSGPGNPGLPIYFSLVKK